MESRTWKYFDHHHHHHQVCFFPCCHLLYKRLLQKTSLAPWCEFIFLPPAWTKSEQWIMALATDVVPLVHTRSVQESVPEPGTKSAPSIFVSSDSKWALSLSGFLINYVQRHSSERCARVDVAFACTQFGRLDAFPHWKNHADFQVWIRIWTSRWQVKDDNVPGPNPKDSRVLYKMIIHILKIPQVETTRKHPKASKSKHVKLLLT